MQHNRLPFDRQCLVLAAILFLLVATFGKVDRAVLSDAFAQAGAAARPAVASGACRFGR